MNSHIRPETAADYTAVYTINAKAFTQDGEAKLVAALRHNKDAFIPELSLVAVKGTEVIGYILFTKISIVSIDQKIFESLALAPVAVDPEYQQQGIGKALIQYGLDKAKALGYASVIVLGHEAYYPKFGFVPAVKWQIKAPFEVPENAFMGLELIPGSLTNVSGTVRYAREFDNV
ncbi:GNAT family N-acetyltransferase [Taibaiella sp. KBW10]|uniref:GNAT family N-acetyltransferase n=1 Tax=Taibaiella sp. KBW10 TaxID=2153357 RepID=UPI000F598D73|nr:N-acetyltransferase [Taibaiella sp. KBW10]RQO32366.1 GNAT family N-acetyltransferase [Taibaiella sp. KBW10]